MLKELYRSKLFLIIETIILTISPLIFIHRHPEYLFYRVPVMILCFSYIYFVMKTQNISLKDIGVSKTNLKKSIVSTSSTSCLLALIVGLTYLLKPELSFISEVANESRPYPIILPLLWYVLISAPLQEIIYRGFYLARLKLVSSNQLFLVLYSSFIFGLIHTPFSNINISIGTFFLGIYWAVLFLKYKNLAGPIFSHSFIGGILVLSSILQR